MPKTLGRLIAAAVAALVVVMGVLIYRAGLNQIPPPPSESTVLQEAIGIGTRGSHDAWRFRAKRVITSPDGALTTLEDVESAALYKSGKPYLELRADRITINVNSRDVTVSGHVTLSTRGAPIARSLQTEIITWNNALQQLSIPTATVLTTDGKRLRLGTVRWNVATGEITVRKIEGTTKL